MKKHPRTGLNNPEQSRTLKIRLEQSRSSLIYVNRLRNEPTKEATLEPVSSYFINDEKFFVLQGNSISFNANIEIIGQKRLRTVFLF